MLRAVLIGVLSLSAVGACKSEPGAARSQPGVVAGKVLEVKGSVEVEHGGTRRPLASGATVEGDDTVITGADGNVVIELAHNTARWALGPGKQVKVRESLAWTAAKVDGPAHQVDQDTSAAGRPAERNAAGTVASAAEDQGRDEETAIVPAADLGKAAPPEPAAMPASLPPPPGSKVTKGSSEADKSVGVPERERTPVKLRPLVKGKVGGGSSSFKPSAPTASRGEPETPRGVDAVVKSQVGKLRGCVAGKVPVRLTVQVASGAFTATYATRPDDATDTCIRDILSALSWPENGTYTIVLRP